MDKGFCYVLFCIVFMLGYGLHSPKFATFNWYEKTLIVITSPISVPFIIGAETSEMNNYLKGEQITQTDTLQIDSVRIDNITLGE